MNEHGTPVIGNYHVCGQYSGPVTKDATVSVQCDEPLTAARYAVVQFPETDQANLCEIEICANGERSTVALLRDCNYQ